MNTILGFFSVLVLTVFFQGCSSGWEESSEMFFIGYKHKGTGCVFSIESDNRGASLSIKDGNYQEFFIIDWDEEIHEMDCYIKKGGKTTEADFRNLIEEKCLPVLKELPPEGKEKFNKFFGEYYDLEEEEQ